MKSDPPPRLKFILPLGIFLASFLWFCHHAAPAMAPLDSAELSAAGATLGIAHSPGYPLYVLAGNLFGSAIPLGNWALRMNLFSALCASAALALLACLLADAGPLAAIAGAAALFFSPAFQKQAVVAEVFTLQLALMGALFLILKALLSASPPEMNARRAYLLALVFGLACGNQHTIVLLLPGLAAALAVWLKRVPSGSRARVLGVAAAFGVLGVLVYAFVFLRAQAPPLLNWEEPDTWERFWGLLTRARYGTAALAQGAGAVSWSARTFQRAAGFYASLIAEDAGWTGLCLAAAGAWAAWRRDRVFAAATFLAWLFSGPFFFILAKTSPGPNARMVMERFLPLSAFFMAYWFGAFFGAAGRYKSGWVLLAAVLFWRHPAPADARSDYLDYDYTRNILRTLPRGSFLLLDRADEAEFGMAYLQYAENRRPDLRWADCNAGVTPSLYGKDYYRLWGKPRLERRQEVESALAASHPGGVYYASLEENLVKLNRRRDGYLLRVEKVGAAADAPGFPWEEIYSLRWKFPLPYRGAIQLSSHCELLAKHYLERKRIEKAEGHFRGLAAASRAPDYWWGWIAGQYFTAGRMQEAEAGFKKALGYAENAAAYSNLGVIHERRGDAEGAERMYRKAFSIDPGYAQAYYNLATSCWRRRDWKCSVWGFEKVAGLNPTHPDAARFLAAARARLSNP
ncbi:MAG: hypothetical protein A3G41_03425 [Elusimicrobia bacterium RIFCSPLOWO2_12_FULL_59_9]|nr:MAG: hypothetical protein A3G41_03425 [Elusimicrobia bacterium RIFCSPLOWO2_12_FULL_59_9]